MLEDMQDMLFSATRRNRAWVESRAILFLEGRQLERQTEIFRTKEDRM